MNTKILLAFCVSVAFVIAEVSGRSVRPCGGVPGKDYCASELSSGLGSGLGSGLCSGLGTYEHRPVALKRIKTNNWRPIGDACGCRSHKVQPVALPKQKLVWKEKKNLKCDPRPLIPAPDHFHDFTQDEEEIIVDSEYESSCNYKPLYPVDAVSLDLVQRMQQSAAAAIPEEKLQYGFWKLPKEVPTYKVSSNIPEEGLHTFNRQIVELKKPQQIVNCGTEFDEDFLIENKEPHPIAYLSYKDLGFVPESVSNGKFITSYRDGNKKRFDRNEEIKNYDESSEEVYKYRVKGRNSGYENKKLKGSCEC